MNEEWLKEFEERDRKEREAAALMTHNVGFTQVAPPIEPESEAFKRGRQVSPTAQRIFTYADALGQTLPKKMFGQEAEDYIRGAQAQLKETNPTESFFGSLGASAVPGVIAGGVGMLSKGATAAPTMLRNAATAVFEGGVQGGAQSVGESKSRDPLELLKEAGKGSAYGGTFGGGFSMVGDVAGAGARNIASRTTDRGTMSDAQRELIKALQRDTKYGSTESPALTGLNVLKQLGPEARLVDVGSESTRKLANILAQLPGKATTAMREAIGARQDSRAARLMTAADAALGTKGKGYSATLGELEAQKMVASKPFYDQLKGLQVQADDELLGLLRRAGKESLGKAQRLSRLAGEDQVSIGAALEEARDAVTNAAIPGKPISFQSLDQVKQALYDLETKFKISGEAQEASGFAKLRKELTAKLDSLSPKDKAGGSIYAQARDAYAGPAQMKDAVEAGRKAFALKQVELEELIKDMSSSEMDAFRVGALQGLREKTGSVPGQTKLLKMSQEPNTSGPLKLVFGDKFEAFQKAVENEKRLKLFESVGGGSSSISNLAQAEDLGADIVQAVGNVATAPATGNIAGALAGISTLTKKVALPESTRNQLALMLLQQGGDAETTLKTLDQVIRNMNKRSQLKSSISGSAGATSQQRVRNK
jgi:hypothetical protein